MRRTLTTAVLMTLVFIVLTGIIYPFAMTGLAQVFFGDQGLGGLAANSPFYNLTIIVAMAMGHLSGPAMVLPRLFSRRV